MSSARDKAERWLVLANQNNARIQIPMSRIILWILVYINVWRGCLCRILDVNSTGVIVTKQGLRSGVYVFTEAKAGYFIKQY